MADPATEEEIRSRVVGYLADRRAFDLRAAARLHDEFDWDSVLLPSRYGYHLELEGGRWLLADRRLYDNDGIKRPRWLRGLL